MCPSCHELCGEKFALTGESCKNPEEAPSSFYYPKDNLKCRAFALVPSILVVLGFALLRL